MAGITLTQAETGLSNALAALAKAVNAQGYSHSGAQVSISKQNQSVGQLQDNIDFWDNKVQELSAGDTGLITSQIVPL